MRRTEGDGETEAGTARFSPWSACVGEDAAQPGTAGTPRLAAGREDQSHPRPVGLDRFKPAKLGRSRCDGEHSPSRHPARAAKRSRQVGSGCTGRESREDNHCWSVGSAGANAVIPAGERGREGERGEKK